MLFVSFNSNTTGVTCGAGDGTRTEHLNSSPVFSVVRVARSLVFYVMFCRSLLALLSVFSCPLYCLSFFDLLFPITPLVSSNSS
jgi:hypothetical protein